MCPLEAGNLCCTVKTSVTLAIENLVAIVNCHLFWWISNKGEVRHIFKWFSDVC